MKLLSFTTRSIVGYSSLLAIISIPIFYFIVHEIEIRKLDYELRIFKVRIEEAKKHIKSQAELEFYQKLHPEIELAIAGSKQTFDTLFTSLHYDVETRQQISHREYRTSVSINNKLYELIVRQPMIGTNEVIGAVAVTQIIFMIGLLIGSFIINRNISKRVWKPFYEMTAALKDFKLGKTSELVLTPSKIVEFEDLRMRLSELAFQNMKAYELQKKFTANAAHELQTPLAIFQANLDLLLQSKSLDEEQAIIIQALLETVLKLSRLQSALLLLTRIESQQFLRTDKVQLSNLSDEIISRFAKNLENKALKVKKVSDRDAVEVTANRELLEILLTNLLTNAIRFSPEGGEIGWKINLNYLEVQNFGEKINLEPSELFERFKKDDRKGNIGLGLAIAKQICETYSWRIDYKFESKIHIFTVHFN